MHFCDVEWGKHSLASQPLIDVYITSYISCNLQRYLDPTKEQSEVGLAKGAVMTQVIALLYIYA